MAEYIDREAAVKIAEKFGLSNGTTLGRHAGLADCIASEIAALPPADVEPVIHAYWDDSGRYRFKGGPNDGEEAVRCTNCGCAITTAEYEKFNWFGCPVCRAKMDGGGDNAAD